MVTSKATAELLLLSCLLLIVTSSPVQDKKVIWMQRGGRFHQTKTSVKGSHPDPNSPVAHFDSSLRPITDIFNAHDQVTSQNGDGTTSGVKNGVDNLSEFTGGQTNKNSETSDSATKTFRGRGPQSHLPAITNFGDRIQKDKQGVKSSECNIKGGCSTVNFTPDGALSVSGVTPSGNNFQEHNTGRVDDALHDQEQQFTVPVDTKTTPAVQPGQNIHDGANDDQRFPDYEGLLSPHGISQVTEGDISSSQDEQKHISEENVGLSDQTDFDYQTQFATHQQSPDYSYGQSPDSSVQEKHNSNEASGLNTPPGRQFVMQHDSPDYNYKQTYESGFPVQEVFSSFEPHVFSSSSSGFPEEQTNSDTEKRKHQEDISTFNQQFFPQSVIPDVQETLDPEIQISGHSDVTHSGKEQFFPETFTSGAQETVDPQHQTSGHSSVPHDENHQHVDDGHNHHDDGHHHHDDGQHHHFGNPIDWLRDSVPGNPGEDYPIFYQVPQTSFNCKQQAFSAGIYGDMEASCQVFHICKESGGQDSFLCPNGTVFNQKYFVCDWWYNFKCSDTPGYYSLNAQLYWDLENFTPSQVLNAPASRTDGMHPNVHTSAQDTISSFSGSDNRRPSVDEFSGQNNAVKSTIAIDNSAAFDKNQHVHGQRPEEHVFTEGKTTFSNEKTDFSGKDQHDQQQVQDDFATSFFDTTREAHFATVSPFGDSSLENASGSSNFNKNKQGGVTFHPVASDTGGNRQPGADSGTRYPGQNRFEQQPFNVFESHGQTVPVLDEEKGFDNTQSNKHHVTQMVSAHRPASFNGRNPIGDGVYKVAQNTQSNNVGHKDHVTQFEVSPEISSNAGGIDENHHVQSQDHFTDSYNGNTLPTFTVGQIDERVNFESGTGELSADGRNEFSGVSQITQEVKQEHFPTTFDTKTDSFGTKDGSFTQQKEDVEVHNEHSQRDHFNQGNPTLPSFTIDNQDSHSKPDVQQEHIPATFDNSGKTSFNDEESRGFGPQTVKTDIQDVRQTPFEISINENVGNTGVSVNRGNQEVQQEHITTGFDGINQNVPNRDENHNVNVPFGNDQSGISFGNDGNFRMQNFNENGNAEQGFMSYEQNDNLRSQMEDYKNNQVQGPQILQNENVDSSTNDRNSNADTYEGIQQEYVPKFDDENSNGPNTNERPAFISSVDSSQKQTPIAFHPNNEENFRNRNTFQDQNERKNHQTGQEHITIQFDERRTNSLNSGSDRNIHGFGANTDKDKNLNAINRDNIDINTHQVVEQKHVSSQFESNSPNKFDANQRSPNSFDGGIVDRNQFNQGNKNIQQENVIFPFDGINQNSFTQVNNRGNKNNFVTMTGEENYPFSPNGQNNYRGQNSRAPYNQQDRITGEFTQNDIPITFVGDGHGTHDARDNQGNQYDQQYENNNFRVNTPVGNLQFQQEYAPVSFDGIRTDVSESPDSNGNRVVQDGYINTEQENNLNQQNNFRPSFDGNQNTFRNPQNPRQENIPIIFDNSHQIHGQNSFSHDENYRSTQNRDAYQSNSNTGTNGVNHNTNEAFRIRLNNFQPENIHMMNRGAWQPGNNHQPRMSFRSHGQNVQNTVNFPGNPINFIPNLENGAGTPYTNDKGSSNRNFFITNGHQQRDLPQQSASQPFSNEQPINNIQDVRQHDGQELNQGHFNDGPITDDRKRESFQNTGLNQEVQSTGGNDHRIKGNFHGRSLNVAAPQVTNINPNQYSVVPINADDVNRYNQPAPDSPSSMSYNGWKPIVKH